MKLVLCHQLTKTTMRARPRAYYDGIRDHDASIPRYAAMISRRRSRRLEFAMRGLIRTRWIPPWRSMRDTFGTRFVYAEFMPPAPESRHFVIEGTIPLMLFIAMTSMHSDLLELRCFRPSFGDSPAV